jgi:hypothetical protein
LLYRGEDMPQKGPCTFEGSAAVVEVRGTGSAVLVEQAPFEHGRVRLSPVKIGDAPLVAEPSSVTRLAPVLMTREAEPIAVSYTFGAPITVVVAQGGDKGMFKGTLDRAPRCREAWCEVIWQAGAAKKIELWYDGHRGEVPEALLVDALPIAGGSLSQIVLRGAEGRLRCDDGARPASGELSFGGQAITLGRVRIGSDGFEVVVTDDVPPASPWPKTWLAAPVLVGLAMVAAGVGAFVWQRRHDRVKAPGEPGKGAMPAQEGAPARVFYSYAPADTDLQAKLAGHLRILERRGRIQGYSQRDVGAGEDWRGQVDAALEQADLVLLLVSADFLASDYCWGFELTRAMERHVRGEARVIPVILRSCAWRAAPETAPERGPAAFARLDPLPRGGAPIMEARSVDAAMQEVAEAIEAAAAEVAAGKARGAAARAGPEDGAGGRIRVRA